MSNLVFFCADIMSSKSFNVKAWRAAKARASREGAGSSQVPAVVVTLVHVPPPLDLPVAKRTRSEGRASAFGNESAGGETRVPVAVPEAVTRTDQPEGAPPSEVGKDGDRSTNVVDLTGGENFGESLDGKVFGDVGGEKAVVSREGGGRLSLLGSAPPSLTWVA